jgi:protein SCO1/2
MVLLMKKQFSIAIIVSALLAAAVTFGIKYANRGPQLGGDFTLNFQGQPWTLTEHKKDLSILYIGYAKCPDVCPMALSHTAAAFKTLSEKELSNVQMIFISVDAEHDTADAVSVYAAQFDKSFIGLTGTKEQIDAAIKPFGASYMVEENKKSYLGYSIAHTDRLYFLDSNGRVLDMISSPRSSDEITQKIKENL